MIGRVTGMIRTEKTAKCLINKTFLLVRAGEKELAAADFAGACEGDRVIVVTGNAAAKYDPEVPVDAAVVAIVDPGAHNGGILPGNPRGDGNKD